MFEDHSTARCAPPSWATESSPNSRKTRSYSRSARSVPASPDTSAGTSPGELVQVQPPQRPAVARVAREQRALHDLRQVHDAEDGQVEVREMRLQQPPLVRSELFDRVIHGAAMLLADRSDLAEGAVRQISRASGDVSHRRWRAIGASAAGAKHRTLGGRSPNMEDRCPTEAPPNQSSRSCSETSRSSTRRRSSRRRRTPTTPPSTRRRSAIPRAGGRAGRRSSTGPSPGTRSSSGTRPGRSGSSAAS